MRSQFATFLASHPNSSIEGFTGPAGERQGRIQRPWGDASLALWVRDDAAALADALNNLILPERLTAIWHRDTKRLEVIWTAQKLPTLWENLADRSFDFELSGKTYSCSFGPSSDRLMVIARNFLQASASTTAYRNLQSYWSYLIFDKQHHKLFGFAETPLSFWIDNIEWHETETVAIVQHLNFYMTYYDRLGPFVIVHTPPAEPEAAQRARYLHGEFPKKITGTKLDGTLLSFWIAGYANNPMMAYLLYYRILEYAAYNFIDFEARANIRKILSAPNFNAANADNMIAKILDFVASKSMDDIAKLKRVIRINVEPALLWRDIQANMGTFAVETVFDGGFTMKPLVSKGDTEKTFCDRSLDAFSDQIRILRNTMAHGKQLEMAGVIEATDRNVRLIRPWMHLVATAAGEVILYKDVA